MQVFETAELLETILLEVTDVRTVLLSQRTHSTFKNTIASSVKLRRMLWLLPPVQTTGRVQINPLFLREPRDGYEKPPRVPFEIQTCFSMDEPFRLIFEINKLVSEGGSWRGMTLISHGDFKCSQELFGGTVNGCNEDYDNYEASATAGVVADGIGQRIKHQVWGVLKRYSRVISFRRMINKDNDTEGLGVAQTGSHW